MERIKIKYLVSTKVTDGPHETPSFVEEGIRFLSVEGVVDEKTDPVLDSLEGAFRLRQDYLKQGLYFSKTAIRKKNR